MHETAVFFTVSDVARALNVTPATVRAWENDGRIKAIRTAGGVRLISDSEVDRVRTERANSEGRRG